MARFRLSAFSDEYSPNLDEQIEGLLTNHIRMTELRGVDGVNVSDLTPDEVASLSLAPERPGLDAAGPFRIPLLDQVLGTVPPHGTLQAEIKGYSAEYADLFDAAVRAAGLTEANIVVSSFNLDALADFHARKPSYRTLLLLGVPKDRETDVAGMISAAAEAKFDFFCPGLTPRDRALSSSEADAVREAGLGLRAYGVNTPEDLRRARDILAEAFTCNFWHQAFDWAREIGGVELLP